jgi:hypothetical protein
MIVAPGALEQDPDLSKWHYHTGMTQIGHCLQSTKTFTCLSKVASGVSML